MNEVNSNGNSTASKLPPELRYKPQPKSRAILIFQWAVILIAGAGFTFKFVEYTISVFNNPSDIVNFAITPLIMYMCVAAGFLSLFLWTVSRGDYKDIERPKFRLFERELELDEAEEERIARLSTYKGVSTFPISRN
jgi:nitrogen fixation-related uncharacterized protein